MVLRRTSWKRFIRLSRRNRLGGSGGGQAVEESVHCGECGQRYDSNQNAFCPRCGSLSRSQDVGPAVASAQRRDPDLRRLRAAGVVLMVVGGLAAAQFLWMAVAPPAPGPDSLEVLAQVPTFADQPGGDMRLHVTQNGSAAGVPVSIAARNGSILLEGETANGWFNATLPVAFANVTVGATNSSQLHLFYVPQGSRVLAEVDLAEPLDGPEWHAASTSTVIRTIGGFLAFLALVVVAGGVAAWRRRPMALAVTGGIIAVFPGLIVMPLLPLAGFLLLLPGLVALALIVRGRRHFQRSK